ncbi:MAG: RNA polymerase sigma factor [Planctomycetota bacterium]|jgi:RNA polymerase sigma-70 factor (ECF subfamily)
MPTGPTSLEEMLVRGYRYALALTNDEWVACDLLGEACVAVAKAGGRWDEAYLLSAVRSRFIDHCRATGRERAARNGMPAAEAATPPPPPRLTSSDDLERALTLLRPEEREALYLHAVVGMTAKQIAHMTGGSRSTVLSLLQRGRRRVAEHLGAPSEEVRSDG